MNFPGPDRRPTLAEMMGSTFGAGAGPSAPRRRLTMAEMLKQSPLVGNTVSMPEAVEAAQAAKAQREAVAEAEAAQPAATQAEAVAEEPIEQQISVTSRHRYQLYARVDGKWIWQCGIAAAGHADAMRQVIAWLRPQHDALAIRLEQDETPARAGEVSEAA
jgi:hypothetical protein